MKELSKILNISISTVSKALNNSKEISAQTKKRVLELAEKYDYQPHPLQKTYSTMRLFLEGMIHVLM